MLIKEVIAHLESLAPKGYQESYDNSGLLVGSQNAELKNVLVSLDVTEEVVEEAIAKNCQLIISHHPIIFSGLKSLTGKNYVERTILKAIKNDVALYAIHTNLDNVVGGVNAKIAEVLGIQNCKILAPKKGLLKKLVCFVPLDYKESVLKAMFDAGAGHIGNYSETSFQLKGQGTFKGNEHAKPHVGEKEIRHYEDEYRLEVIVPAIATNSVVGAMMEAHPYEEVAYDIYSLDNSSPQIGSGMIGELEKEIDAMQFLDHIKTKMKADSLRYTAITQKKIKRIAWCGGSGSFLLTQAIAAGADLFMSSDFKYHQFFDADNQIIIADIGHYENEQYTIDLIASELKKKFSSFAVLLTEINTNPINYL